MIKGYIGTNQYRYRSFYVKLMNVTKILIDVFVDVRSGFINIAEINIEGRVEDEDIIRGAAEMKAKEIENMI